MVLLAQKEVEAVVKEAVVKVEVEAQITLLNLSGEECPRDKRYWSLVSVVEPLFSTLHTSKQWNPLVEDDSSSCPVAWKKNSEKWSYTS